MCQVHWLRADLLYNRRHVNVIMYLTFSTKLQLFKKQTKAAIVTYKYQNNIQSLLYTKSNINYNNVRISCKLCGTLILI